MSRKYKFQNPEGLYFVSFATVYWIDIFTRDIYPTGRSLATTQTTGRMRLATTLK